jgi:hypothetical protein
MALKTGDTIYLTKHFLTKGIQTATVRHAPQSFAPKMVVINDPERGRFGLEETFHKPDWHETRTGAVNRAIQMIESARRHYAKKLNQVDSLEKEINFELVQMRRGISDATRQGESR